ncbi:MAG: acetylglutamate kinase [Planctomycetes bacterium]|nr:acetylglutamate kinase [Planctomycetota bacterium]
MTTGTGPIVIKLGGTGVESPVSTPALWRAVIDLHASERRRGATGVILVHGGGKAVDAALARLGFTTERRQGLRVTPPDQMRHIAEVLGAINKSIVGALKGMGQPALGLCPGECGTASARRLKPGGEDIGLVGEINGGDATFTLRTLAAGIIPVFGPVAIDDQGGFLNVNADDVATGLAGVNAARLLVLLTDVPGVRGPGGAVIERATPEELEGHIASGVIHGGMVPKVRAAVRAAELAGVGVLVSSWQRPETLSTIDEQHGVGTLISASARAASSSQLAHASKEPVS